IVDCRSFALIDLDLFDARVALDINDPIAFEQVVIELLRSANVQDRVRLAIKLPDFLERQTGCRSFFQIPRAKRPSIFEIEFACETVENFSWRSEERRVGKECR